MSSTQPVFILGTTVVTDGESVGPYLQRIVTTIERYGGRIRVTGSVTVLEGDTTPNAGAVIEFPDAITAAAWFDSPEYREVRALDRAGGRSTVVLVEDLDHFSAERSPDRECCSGWPT